MAKFAWEGKTRTGASQKGEMEAPNQAAVTATLRRQGIMPSKIKERGKGMDRDIKIPGMEPRITTKDLVVFTRQFATMIDAGLPLVQCLDILGRQQDNKTFKKILVQVKEDVESGSTFADALKKHPKAFDELYVNLVAAGEVGGILDTILNRLAAYIEKALKLKKQIKGAMTYPATVVSIAFIVIAVILVFVIPAFESMFADFGGALPAPTQIVINMSNFVQDYIIAIIGGIILSIFAFKRIYRTQKGRARIDDWALKLPVFGPLIRKAAVAKFTRTLGTMISSGVPILDGLDIVAKTAGNKTVEKAIYKVRQSISEGKTIAEPLEKSGVFPPMVCQMISVGEQSGAIDTMLNKIADFYDDEVDDAVSALTAMLEPLLMLFLGTTVGGLVIAMYLPIFQLAGTVGG
ncbi:type II secretion system F family protein [Geoalkalibacter halelectricus]|uniref:Type II secretion system F family protein n=1 Tax=Geoalkalibacter halelectricus TaxID=2847045 RepID=A0ABY5ZQ64_9BACT|nr:type II secretion system F family protein [Geoalkalibacter halelectricus]MDO3376780.1 type II secretion system F family protein [Geoalkalibacter halelectricus]UWZ81268.1 type II secretion system F family protein [Geoalkalibacter halelectricus]